MSVCANNATATVASMTSTIAGFTAGVPSARATWLVPRSDCEIDVSIWSHTSPKRIWGARGDGYQVLRWQRAGYEWAAIRLGNSMEKPLALRGLLDGAGNFAGCAYRETPGGRGRLFGMCVPAPVPKRVTCVDAYDLYSGVLAAGGIRGIVCTKSSISAAPELKAMLDRDRFASVPVKPGGAIQLFACCGRLRGGVLTAPLPRSVSGLVKHLALRDWKYMKAKEARRLVFSLEFYITPATIQIEEPIIKGES